MLSALDDPEPMVADEAQLQLGALPAGELGQAVLEDVLGKQGLQARDAIVRARVAEAIAARADALGPAAVRALAERLEVEPRLRLRWRLVELLQELSGERHRLDPRPWGGWAEGLPADWRPRRGLRPRARRAQAGWSTSPASERSRLAFRSPRPCLRDAERRRPSWRMREDPG